MNYCKICSHVSSEFDGEVEYNYDGAVSGCYSIEESCSLGRDDFFKVGGENCNAFREREVKCVGCGKILPMTKLVAGFHSEECKERYIIRMKDMVFTSRQEYEITKEELEKAEGDISKMDLETKLSAIEEDIEFGENMLRIFS